MQNIHMFADTQQQQYSQWFLMIHMFIISL